MSPTIEDFRGIHHVERNLERARTRIRESHTISTSDRTLILAFERATFLQEALGKQRRLKILQGLHTLCTRFLRVSLAEASKEELKRVVHAIEESDYANWTKYGLKGILRKFYTWHAFGDAYVDHARRHDLPAIVSWMHVSLRKRDRPRVKAADILTEDEVERLIAAADRPRDRAFISLLYELGARIGEIGGLRIGDITKDQFSYVLDLEGKTGHRTPRIILSAPYIPALLDAHPSRDPKAPLWVHTRGGTTKKLDYSALKKIVERLTQRAKITKRIYPHLFRHTRPTHLLRAGVINEAQAKVYFGWAPDSQMLATYSHLISQDVNDALLRAHGIQPAQRTESVLKPRPCAACRGLNAPTARFCQYCSAVLDLRAAIELEQTRSRADTFMDWLASDAEGMAFLSRKASEYRAGQHAPLPRQRQDAAREF